MSFAGIAAEYFNASRDISAGGIPVSAKQIHNKLLYMESKYKQIIYKYTASGFGVMELGEGSIRDQIERQFPCYRQLHAFLSTKANVVPEYVLQAGHDDQVIEVGIANEQEDPQGKDQLRNDSECP